MNEIAHATMLYSSSYGVQRIIWSFSSDSRLFQPAAYSMAPSAPVDMDGLVVAGQCLVVKSECTSGSLVTNPIEAPFFNWLVPWWNAETAGTGSLEIFLQFETGTAGEWSRWYPMGEWSKVSRSFSEGDENAKVETDTLFLANKSSRFRLKLVLQSGSGGEAGSVVVHRFGVIARDRESQRPPARHYFLKESEITTCRRSQMMESKGIRGRICSPTCAAMVLEHLGSSWPTAFVAADCYDAGAKIFGNWPFNVASLWRLGARARLDFFANAEMAAAELQAGHLLIASIHFGQGELAGAPIAATKGHLVLMTGISRDKTGAYWILVNDPAASSEAEVRRSYDLAEFEKAWTGLAYVIEGRR